jgi:pimeloyl-ACP methyl ester carboxylesterase
MSASGGYYPYAGDDPAGVDSAITALRRVGDTLSTLAGEVERDTKAIKASWPKGRTGELAAQDAAKMGGALDEGHQAFDSAVRALIELHAVVLTNRRKVDTLNRAHQILAGPEQDFAGMQITSYGVPPSPEELTAGEESLMAARARSGFASLADIDRAHARLQSLVSEETTTCDDRLNRLASESSGLPGGAAGKSRYDVSFNLLWTANQVADILSGKVRFPTEPKAVHDAWLLLPVDVRQQLLLADPLRFGNLNGIPAADRDVANRATLTAQLDLLSRACLETGIPLPSSAEDLTAMSPGALARLEEATNMSGATIRQALNVSRQVGRALSGTTLLAYEPGAYGGKGRAAIAFGDLDRANNVAVCVPGLQSGLDNFENVAGDALHLYNQARQADPGRSTAVIAWQGYDAPTFFNVASQSAAEQGAKLLAADVNALRTTHEGAIGTLTVVGHSYGSTTTSLALQREQMDVDQAVLIGSPGMGGDATTVADLHLEPGHLFVGAASRDVVTVLPRLLGTDPANDTVGGIRFGTESPNRGWTFNKDDHSLYFDDSNNSESLHGIADITTDHSDRLGDEGLLVGNRDTGLVTALVDNLAGLLPGNLLDVNPLPNGAYDPEFFRTPKTIPDHAPVAGVSGP